MGSVNLDNTGSGSAITLSSDGTSLLLDGTAIGGGGGDPDLYRDNAVSATTPVAAGNNGIAIGPCKTCGQFFPAAYSFVLGIEDMPTSGCRTRRKGRGGPPRRPGG